MVSEDSNRELAQKVRGTKEASMDEREKARDELLERGYSEDTLLDLAGPWSLEDVDEGFAP